MSSIKPWKTIEERVLVSDQYIRVNANDVELPNGHIINRYYTIKFNDWACVFPVTSEGEVIMIKQYRYALDKVLYELPCGLIDSGEDAMNAAKREFEEETGYTTKKELIYLGRTSPSPAKIDNYSFGYLATNCVLKGEQKLDEAEEIEVVKVPLNKVKDLILNEEVLDSYFIAIIYRALDILNQI